MSGIDDIKKTTDLADYVRSCGIALEKHGARDLKGLCPFHDDHNPSLIVTPSKQLFNCPVCGTGGSVVDFAMKFHKTSMKEAIKKLSKGKQVPSEKPSAGPAKGGERPPAGGILTLPIERANELLEKTVAFYEKTFADSHEGRHYLELRGLTDAGSFGKHRVGYANGKLLKALPSGGRILEELETLGVLVKLPKGGYIERFKYCVVFPILDSEGNIVTLYARNCDSSSDRRHLYLPNRPTGLWNVQTAKTYPELILVEGVLDALSLEAAGFANVIAIQGTNGIKDSDLDLLRELGVERLVLAFDGDAAGQKAAERLRERLRERNFPFGGFVFPENHDPNGLLMEFGAENLQKLLSEPPEKPAAGVTNQVERPAAGGIPKPAEGDKKHPVQLIDGGFSVQFDLRRYEVLGLERDVRKLKATVRVVKSGRVHADTIDFYSSRMRKQLQQEVCLRFDELPETVERDMERLLKTCELRASESEREDSGESEKPVEITPLELKEAENFAKSPDLIARILSDFEKLGLVGEEGNKLLCYLAMTSRKTEEPLSVLILSSSGGGKTALQDAALAFCPPEDLVKLTSLSGKALFYKERSSLKHKVLALEEGDGAEDASYAIRSLISSDGLTSEATIRDPKSGRLTTMENKVEGPTAVFFTSTNPEVDPETKSRFFVTGIDESREQTRRILEFQRKRRGLSGLGDKVDAEAILRVHRNFQRILRPLKVVNPFAESLGFDDDRLQGRRAQPQYLRLIEAMAFLRQFTKEVKTWTTKNKKVEYIEVDEEDVAAAHELAVEIMGRSLDELSIPARNLLEQLEKLVAAKEKHMEEKAPDDWRTKGPVTFTRREVRDFTGWGQTRIRTHLNELCEMEYAMMVSGGVGRTLQRYRLIYDGQGKNGERFIPGVGKTAEQILKLKKAEPDS